MTFDWSNPQAIGYPLLFGAVLLGSIVPIVPTGAVVGAGAAVAMTTHHLSLPLVLLVATLGAVVGDLVTYAVARVGGGAAVAFVSRGQSPEQLEKARARFTRYGWQVVVVGRLVPAGRIPTLVAAGTLGYSWRRMLPTAVAACLLWAVAYALLGILSGGLFDNPLVASLVAAALVLVVGAISGGIAALVRRRRATPREPDPPPRESHTPPRESDTLPRESNPLPRESDPPPRESNTRARESDTPPRESHTPPRESDTPARESHTLPRESHLTGRESDTPPRESDTLPRESHLTGRESDSGGPGPERAAVAGETPIGSAAPSDPREDRS